VFEGTAVAMVVPGGPAFKPAKDGKRIEKGDILQKIDNKDVTATNLIPLLRGVDVVGSHVKIDVVKADTSQALTFNLTRSDIRSVEKMKDLYMKLAELQAEARSVTRRGALDQTMQTHDRPRPVPACLVLFTC
jgi:C-terminal processing protease CtpA/Prc